MIPHPEIEAATPQQRQRLKELDSLIISTLEEIRKTTEETNAATVAGDEKKIVEIQERATKALRKSAALFSEQERLILEIDNSFIKSFNGDKKSILQAARNALKHVKKSDFQKRTNREADFVRQKNETDKPKQQTTPLFAESYTGARRFTIACLYLFFEAFKRAKLDEEPLDYLVELKIKEWGYYPAADPALSFPNGEQRGADPEPDAAQSARQLRTQESLEKLRNVSTPAFMALVHGRGTDTLIQTIQKKPDKVMGSGRAVIKFEGATVTLENFEQLNGLYSVSTDKLFRTALAEFTKVNHIGATGRTVRETTVYIPLSDFIERCGYDLQPHANETEEAAKKRIANAKKKARLKIRKDLDILYSGSIEWTENEKEGKTKDYLKTRIIEKAGIQQNTIIISFGKDYANYLIHRTIEQFSVSLLSIDERNPNTYKMGVKMTEYYSNDTNYRTGRNDRLTVKTLLSVCSLPDFETITQRRNSWRERIQKPFEESLNILIDCGFLKSWHYREPANLTDFREWEKAVICFELKNQIDPTERLERNKGIIEARAAAKKEREAKAAKAAKIDPPTDKATKEQ